MSYAHLLHLLFFDAEGPVQNDAPSSVPVLSVEHDYSLYSVPQQPSPSNLCLWDLPETYCSTSPPVLGPQLYDSLYATSVHQAYGNNNTMPVPMLSPGYCNSLSPCSPASQFWTATPPPPPPPSSASSMTGTLIGSLEDTALDGLFLKDPIACTNCTDTDTHTALLFEPISPTDSKPPVPKKKDSEKQYRCPVCSHRSKRRHNLIEHMQTHNPNRIRKFACRHCQRSFARKYDMKRHEKIHTRQL